MVAGDQEPKTAGWRRIRRPSWSMIAYGVGLLIVLAVVGMLAMSGLKGGGAGGKKDKGGPGMHGGKSGGGGAKKRPRGGKKGRRGSLPAPSGPEYAALLEANPAGRAEDSTGALDESGETLAESRNVDVSQQVAVGTEAARLDSYPGGPRVGNDREPDVSPGIAEGLPALRAPPA
jgi:hypothetical protein